MKMKAHLGSILFAVMVISAVAAETSATCASDAEQAFVREEVERIETIPGTPESDAWRFYSSTSRNEYVEFNYDESKAGELGRENSGPKQGRGGREKQMPILWQTSECKQGMVLCRRR